MGTENVADIHSSRAGQDADTTAGIALEDSGTDAMAAQL
jgi:hypothetical protein